jgi:hypothetical protein
MFLRVAKGLGVLQDGFCRWGVLGFVRDWQAIRGGMIAEDCTRQGRAL